MLHCRLPLRLESLDRRDLPSTVLTEVPPAFAAGRGLVGNHSRISDRLLQVFNEYDDAQHLGRAPMRDQSLTFDAAGSVMVRVTGADIQMLEPQLNSLGFHTVGSLPELHLIEGYLPVQQLPAVEHLTDYGLLGVLGVPKPQSDAGLVTSEADWVLEADRERNDSKLGGYTGAGKRVGIISDSFGNLSYNVNGNFVSGVSLDIASGDLPNDTAILKDNFGNDEGRAMGQLIHDLAPNASLRFSARGDTETEFAQSIKNLANPAIGNCDIVVDDVYFPTEPFFQHGIVAQAVDYVVSNYNVPYFCSAGNRADHGFELGNVVSVADPTLGSVIDFQAGPGIDTKQRITLGTDAGDNRTRIVLQWDDPWYTVNGVDTDLDLYLYRADTGALVTSSQDNAIASQEPWEDLLFENDTGQTQFDLVIRKRVGPDPGRLRYVEYGNSIMTEYGPNGPTVNPHSAIASAAAVGAIPWFDQTTPEDFTSVGGNVTLFAPNGTKLANPITEPGPRFAALDGTNTNFFYSDWKGDPDTNPNFFGTSAAAPHAAAVAALLLQKNPALTPSDVYTILANTADNSVGDPGWDTRTGAGLINAYDAVASMPVSNPSPFSDNLEFGYLGPQWETRSTGAGRIQVTSNNGPDAGAYHVVLASGLDGTFSRNELILHVNLLGVQNALLSFSQREFGDEDNPMSASFFGSENSDGVALSTDGATWYRIVSLTGATSLNSYQDFTFNLNTIAAAAGITLGSNTRIKFQQVDDYTPTTDGIAFDNIAVASSTAVGGVTYTDVDANGAYGPSDIPESGRVVFVDANNNGQLDYAGGTIVTSGQVPAPITDVRRTLYPLQVVASVVDDANVTVNLTHTYDVDLELALIAPTGKRVVLASHLGGSGDNYTNTVFDDQAPSAITLSSAPFTGRFRPQGVLANFNGLAAAGTWYLEITDNAANDSGTLLNWSLEITEDSKNFANVAIPDNGTVNSQYFFVNAPGVLSDVDVTVNINHTFDADLDMLLIGPNGKMVELSTDNGGSGDNYTNTRFDDEAANSITAGSAPFTGRFKPEGQLSDFDGMSQNGMWVLRVTDDDPGATGALVDWTLHLARTFSPPSAAPIPDNATLTSSVVVPDLGGPITDLDVTLNIAHGYDADLDVFLTSPGGQKIALTTDNGDAGDNFTNTRFDDEANVSVVAGAAPFSSSYRPETPLSLFDGKLSGGTWTLTVTDDAGIDTGSLLGWSLDFHHESKAVSLNVPRPIDDFSSPVTSILSVSGATGLINDLNVQLDVSHTYDADLEVYLTAPTGQKAYLFGHVGGQFNNFTNTVLDDEANVSIINGSAPFTGTYRPETPLDLFDGLNPNGTWLLTIYDTSSGDDGTLNNWSINFTTGERFDVTTSDGRFQIPNLPAGSITLREQLPTLLKHTEPTTDAYALTAPFASAQAGLNFGSIADVTAPTATITQVNPDPRHVVVPSIDIMFSEPVSAFDLGDLVLTRDNVSASLAAATLTSTDYITWTLGNLSGVTLPEGTYQLSLTGIGSSIIDAAKNAFTSSLTESWTMDTTAPTVVSVVRTISDPNTPADTVSWNVQFSEPVIFPTIPNFALFGSAANGAVITGVTGGGAFRTVTATTAADGDLGLRMSNSTNVNDNAGNPVAPLPFDGESYLVNKPDIHVDQVQVNDGSVQRSRVDHLLIKFDQIVNFKHLPTDAFSLVQTPANVPVGFTAIVDNSLGRTYVTLQNFTGASVTDFTSLADGYYGLAVLPLEVYNPNGVLDGNNDGISGDAYYTPTGPAASAIYRLYGDYNGDRTVNGTDFLAFRLAFLQNNFAFDFNNDGIVNGNDFLQFRLRFLQSI